MFDEDGVTIDTTYHITVAPTAAFPEPATLSLLGTCFIGLIRYGRSNARKAKDR
jgi:hypothetical protein